VKLHPETIELELIKPTVAGRGDALKTGMGGGMKRDTGQILGPRDRNGKAIPWPKG